MLAEEEPETPNASDVDEAPATSPKALDELSLQDALDAADLEGMVESLVQAKARDWAPPGFTFQRCSRTATNYRSSLDLGVGSEVPSTTSRPKKPLTQRWPSA